jgi:dihydroorotate dehydrogenase
MDQLFRPLLFRLDPEHAHALTLRLLAAAGSLPLVRALLRRKFRLEDPQLAVEAFGLKFPNPLGLAAGYDKDGAALPGLACLGFGHIELGTVTPRPQAGNPRPRIFRLPQDEALINRMGFPNAGAEALLRRLRRRRPDDVRVGVNIGKGADTLLERAADDYLALLRLFHGACDYLAINVSSPNTLGLRRLQARGHLETLLQALADERLELAASSGKRVPMLVKLAPDLSDAELADAIEAILRTGMDGVIATNTTVERGGLVSPRRDETGGLSGRPLRARSTDVVRRIVGLSQGRLTVVGVGGVFELRDVQEKLDAGAVLVQVYTGLVYRGPGLARAVLSGVRG